MIITFLLLNVSSRELSTEYSKCGFTAYRDYGLEMKVLHHQRTRGQGAGVARWTRAVLRGLVESLSRFPQILTKTLANFAQRLRHQPVQIGFVNLPKIVVAEPHRQPSSELRTSLHHHYYAPSLRQISSTVQHSSPLGGLTGYPLTLLVYKISLGNYNLLFNGVPVDNEKLPIKHTGMLILNSFSAPPKMAD